MRELKQRAPKNSLPSKPVVCALIGEGWGGGWPYFRENSIDPPAFDLCRGLWLIAASLEGGKFEQTQ